MSHSTENVPSSPTRPPWRIALCITELDPGGAERQFARLATGLDRTLFDPEVFCLTGRGRLLGPLRDAGVPVTCLDARGRWDLGTVMRLRRHFRRMRPDLVQTFLFHANIAGRIAARLARVPVVVSGIRVAEPRRWQLRIDRLTDPLVDRHVCVSGAVAEYSERFGGLPAEKLVAIPNAVDAARFADAAAADLGEFGFPADSKVILFVGRLDPQKDPQRLVDAFRMLAGRRDDVRLLLVGAGPLEAELRRRSADLGDRVVFAGRRDDVPALLKASACLALPSRWEGMPNVVLEAMAARIPVVAADAPGTRELLRDGEFGSLVHISGADAFCGALYEVLVNHGRAGLKAKSAQTHVSYTNTNTNLMAGYEALYRSLLSDEGKP